MSENTAHLYSEEAEQSVLGSILINQYVLKKLAGYLNPEHFFMVRHRTIYQAMLNLYNAGLDVDTVSVAGELKTTGKLDGVGGMAYLLTLDAPTAAHVEAYANLVIRTNRRIQLAKLGDKVKALALDENKTFEDISDTINRDVYEATGAIAMKPLPTMKELAGEYWTEVEKLMGNPNAVIGLPTGFKDYDDLTLGLQPGTFNIIAARPGMGKSALLLSIVLNIPQANKELHIAYFSLEMPGRELVQRAASSLGGINLMTLRRGKLADEEHRRFVTAMGTVANMNLHIDSTGGITPAQMRTRCQRLKEQYGRLDLIVVDYVQLMNADITTANRVTDLASITRAMKQLSLEYDVPLLSAAQLSRAVEYRQNKRPILSDLRDSGTLEQDADNVAFLYRDEVYNPHTDYPNGAELILAKHRNGPLGTINLYFEKTLTKFMSATRRDEPLNPPLNPPLHMANGHKHTA